MWCRSCQQDVPGITTGVVPRPKCARCGSVLDRGRFATPHFSYSGVLESGIDLTTCEGMGLALSPAGAGLVSLGVDREIRDRLREVDFVVKQPPPPTPLSNRRRSRGMRGDLPLGLTEPDPQSDVPWNQSSEKAVVASSAEQTSAFFWAAVSVLLAFLLVVSLFWPEFFEMLASRLR